LDRQAEEVLQAAQAHGFERVEQRQMLDWVALVMAVAD
jgi:ribosomal protein L11 methylase PrmA